MPDYAKSKIYKIVCNITGLVYIGSTSQTLNQRLQEHKRQYKYYMNEYYLYVSSFKIIENQNYDIILIEDFPCERKEQLHARERYWIENIECVNMRIPTRTDKEYREDNKEIIKQYNQENKEKIKERNKNYREDNKEIIKQYRENNKEKLKEQRKQYCENNKEKINEKRREYYQNNKEKINEKRREYYQNNKENNST